MKNLKRIVARNARKKALVLWQLLLILVIFGLPVIGVLLYIIVHFLKKIW